MSSQQLNDILAKDSPLMSLAKQQGIDYAQRRGGANSSLAAGSAMAEMARQATPLALQQAGVEHATGMQNQNLESARLENNAGRDQQSNLFNADSANTAEKLQFQTEAARRADNANLETRTNLDNAAMSNDMIVRDKTNQVNVALQQLAGDQDFARQQSANSLARQLAEIEGTQKQFISNNDAAARLMTGYMDSINAILSNKDMNRTEALARVEDMMGGLKDSLNVMSAVSGMDLSGVLK
jgi:hypothetical protein